MLSSPSAFGQSTALRSLRRHHRTLSDHATNYMHRLISDRHRPARARRCLNSAPRLSQGAVGSVGCRVAGCVCCRGLGLPGAGCRGHGLPGARVAGVAVFFCSPACRGCGLRGAWVAWGRGFTRVCVALGEGCRGCRGFGLSGARVAGVVACRGWGVGFGLGSTSGAALVEQATKNVCRETQKRVV